MPKIANQRYQYYFQIWFKIREDFLEEFIRRYIKSLNVSQTIQNIWNCLATRTYRDDFHAVMIHEPLPVTRKHSFKKLDVLELLENIEDMFPLYYMHSKVF